MTPFNQALRLWLRRASVAERALTIGATALAIVLIVWAVLPVDEDAQTVAAGSTPTTSVPGATGPENPGPLASTSSTTAVPSGDPGTSDGSTATESSAPTPDSAPSASPTGQAAPGVGCPSGTGQGVTETEIHVAHSIFDLGGSAGNETFGLPSADDQKEMFDIVVRSVNDAGGICDRTVVPRYYTVNTLDDSAPHEACLQITADKPYVAIDLAAIGANEVACFAQHQTPYIASGATTADARNFAPFAYSPFGYELTYRNGIHAWMQAGMFDDGDQLGTIGVIFQSCFPLYQEVMFQALRDAGIPDENLSKFDYGSNCGEFASPATHQQAIQQFKNDGVTHVLVGYLPTDFGNFTRTADAQEFTPEYRLVDGDTLSVVYGVLAPDWNNIDGALAITQTRFGEDRTPGYPAGEATRRCDKIFTDAGKEPTYQHDIGWGGFVCYNLWLLKDGAEHAPDWSAAGLAHGIGAAGSVADPYPVGPSTFAPGEMWAGRQWREIRASASCRCFSVPDPAFHPGFP